MGRFPGKVEPDRPILARDEVYVNVDVNVQTLVVERACWWDAKRIDPA
jgi:hypothetical protein